MAELIASPAVENERPVGASTAIADLSVAFTKFSPRADPNPKWNPPMRQFSLMMKLGFWVGDSSAMSALMKSELRPQSSKLPCPIYEVIAAPASAFDT